VAAARWPILGDDPRQLTQQKIFSVAPIPAQGALEGYLYIVLAGEAYDSVTQMLQGSYMLRLSIWAAGAGLVFAVGAGLLLFHLLTRRLRTLAARWTPSSRVMWLNVSLFPSAAPPSP